MTHERFNPDKQRELTRQYSELTPVNLLLGHTALDQLIALCIIDGNTPADQARSAIDDYIKMRQGDPSLPELIDKARSRKTAEIGTPIPEA